MKRFFGFLIVIMLFIAGCNKCKKTDCLNGATCDKGVCACADGYEGSDCSAAENAKFAGTYNMPCGGSIAIPVVGDFEVPETAFDITIDANDTPSQISMDLEIPILGSIPVTGTVDGDVITIDEQVIPIPTELVEQLAGGAGGGAGGFDISTILALLGGNLSVTVGGEGMLQGDNLNIDINITGLASGTITCLGVRI